MKSNGVGRVRLEATDIFGMGAQANPQLVLNLKFQLLPFGQTTYTLLRVHAKIFVGNDNQHVAAVEHPPMTEDSTPNLYERQVALNVPLTMSQIKRIEDLRNGSDLRLRVTLSGLVYLKQSNEFERLQEMSLDVAVPQSHWVNTALKVWRVSDLRLLEINFPDSPKEMATARERLERAEGLYRVGDYPHVLSQLRSAFDAMAEAYSQKGVSKETWEKMLSHTHTDVRGKLLGSFAAFRDFLHLGPHEPMPTPQAPVPISRQDARFALIVAHAIFEYFSSENWPAI